MPKLKWKNQFELIDSASNFHNAVRKVFINDPFFRNLGCYQEVPLADLCDGFSSGSLFVDWYLHELQAVLELHGKQHYDMVNFGNKSYSDAMRDFREIQYRDSLKQMTLEKAGYDFHIIPYTMKGKIDASLLKNLLFG